MQPDTARHSTHPPPTTPQSLENDLTSSFRHLLDSRFHGLLLIRFSVATWVATDGDPDTIGVLEVSMTAFRNSLLTADNLIQTFDYVRKFIGAQAPDLFADALS